MWVLYYLSLFVKVRKASSKETSDNFVSEYKNQLLVKACYHIHSIDESSLDVIRGWVAYV
jgi:hypothetical protein